MKCDPTQSRGLVFAALLVCSISARGAGDIQAGVAGRYYPHEAAGLPLESTSVAPFLELDATGVTQSKRLRWALRGYLQADSADKDRTFGDVREASVRYKLGWLETELGIGQEFWGVTESYHLANVVNQRDVRNDVDGEDLLGQPLLKLRSSHRLGSVDILLLPWFRDLELPGQDERLNNLPGLPVGDTMYESGAEKSHLDWVGRFSGSWGSVDGGLYYFSGTSREPRVIAGETGRPVLFYAQIGQWGLDIQATQGNWLWKLEAIRRTGHGAPFFAAVGGVEITSTGVFGSSVDVGWVFEYLHDNRDVELAPATPFQNDLFAGVRLALNDLGDSSLLAGVFVDVERDERYWRVEGFHRFGENVTLELEANLLTATAPQTVLHSLRRDGFVTLRLTYNHGWL